ncbi:MAG: hypothetical protein ACREJM_15675, partial [Candidatus Saccharimonadales bacterium]
PLLHHARLAGPGTEARALEAAVALSGRKQQIQLEDHRFALAAELLEALMGLERDSFAPGDLVKALEDAEIWGAKLAEKHEAKAKAAAVGQFIRTLRLSTRERKRTGTQYGTAEAIEKLRTLSPRKTATSATMPGKSINPSAAVAQDNLQHHANGAAALFGNAVAGPPETKKQPSPLPVTAELPAIRGAVADVADYSEPPGGLWGEV